MPALQLQRFHEQPQRRNRHQECAGEQVLDQSRQQVPFPGHLLPVEVHCPA